MLKSHEAMALYTMYWPDWMCDRAREHGLEGQRLRVLWGGHNQDTRFSRFKVGPGDRVVPVTAIDGVLHALALIEVAQKTTADAWLPTHPDDAKTRLHGCGSELLVARADAGLPLAFTRRFSAAQLERFRYDGSSGPRALKFLDGGKLKKSMSVQGVYRVTAETERLIEQVLAAPVLEPPKTTAAALEAGLRERPDDEGAARVLADAWQEQGDVRGEVMALELALAREADGVEAAKLDARHAALMRAQAGLKKRPGGFPFRAFQGARSFTELSTYGLSLRDGLPEVLVEALFGLGARLVEAEGVHRVEAVRTVGAPLSRLLASLGASAVVGPGSVWSRKKPLSQGEVKRLVSCDATLRLSLAGRLRGSDEGAALPFQAASQWLGLPLLSELELSLADRSLRCSLRVPDGSPLAASRLVALEQVLRQLGGEVSRQRKRRTATGDRPAP
ncbi:MAG: hypothetical protein IAE78_03170 [Myxococcus sp.]|nr:hypothetical protein [Myxococcus sp.]